MTRVIIGVDPHKLSATIEVVDGHEKLLGCGRFSTDQAGYTAMRTYAKAWPERVWAIEGSNVVGTEDVPDLPSAVFATGPVQHHVADDVAYLSQLHGEQQRVARLFDRRARGWRSDAFRHTRAGARR